MEEFWQWSGSPIRDGGLSVMVKRQKHSTGILLCVVRQPNNSQFIGENKTFLPAKS